MIFHMFSVEKNHFVCFSEPSQVKLGSFKTESNRKQKTFRWFYLKRSPSKINSRIDFSIARWHFINIGSRRVYSHFMLIKMTGVHLFLEFLFSLAPSWMLYHSLKRLIEICFLSEKKQRRIYGSLPCRIISPQTPSCISKFYSLHMSSSTINSDLFTNAKQFLSDRMFERSFQRYTTIRESSFVYKQNGRVV